MKTFLVAALLTTVSGPAIHAAEQRNSIALAGCRIENPARAARCGTLEVAENPDKPDGRHLSIGIVVIPASAAPALSDPIVVLQGGPGEDTISSASYYAERFAALLDHRALLLVDQRGTGKSGALPCPLFSAEAPAVSLRDLFPTAAVRRCARQLQAHADLTQYTYPRFAADLEQVRRGLGFGPLNLYAGSYGTRAAQVYIRAYPSSVRTAYLGSTVPMDAANPLTFAKTAQAALEKLFAACSADESCRSAFPQLREEFRAILARLESGTVRVTIPGRATAAPLDRGRVAEWIRSRLYRPKSASTLPWMIHRAFQGDWDPMVQDLLAEAHEADASLSFGLFLSITCSEDVAFVSERDVPAATQGTFLRDYRLRQQQAACRLWPQSVLPDDYRIAVRSSVPTLFVSGDADGATPLRFSERVAAGFAHHLQVIAAGQGHTEWSECLAQLYARLVRSGSVDGLKSRCSATPWPAFKTG